MLQVAGADPVSMLHLTSTGAAASKSAKYAAANSWCSPRSDLAFISSITSFENRGHRKLMLTLYLSFSRAGWFCRLNLRADSRPVSVLMFRLK